MPAYVEAGDVYNTAVMLSLEWGENWLKPIQERLRHYFPDVSEEEATQLDHHCREMMKVAMEVAEQYFFEKIYSLEEAKRMLKERFPKLAEDNLSRLFSQAIWYVNK